MADQDDFTFDEQDDDSEEWYEEEPEKKKKSGGSRSRTLFLLLLLVAIAGGGYFYTMMPADDDGPAAPSKVVVKVKKKAISMPAKPQATKPAPVESSAKAEVKSEMPTEVKPEAKPSAESIAKPVPAKMAEKPAPVPDRVEKAPMPTPVKVVAKPEPTVMADASKKVFESPAATQPANVASMATGPYSLAVGTYALQSSVNGVTKKIRSLGYEPIITPVKRTVSMTRLKVGTFPLVEAAARKADLKSAVPDVFSIRKGKMESIYVGSYLNLDKARRFADSLYSSHAIRLTEEPVEVKKTLLRVTFGAFASEDAAKDTGRQAAAKGIETKVVKNR